MKLILVFLSLLPLGAQAVVQRATGSYVQFVIQGESCEREIQPLAKSLCDASHGELKLVHKEEFRFRTNAEDTLDQWYVFVAPEASLIKVHVATDFNDPVDYNADGKCHIAVHCFY